MRGKFTLWREVITHAERHEYAIVRVGLMADEMENSILF